MCTCRRRAASAMEPDSDGYTVKVLATSSTWSFCVTARAIGKISSQAPGAHHDTANDGAGALARNDLHEAFVDVAHLGPGVGGQRQLHHVALVPPGGQVRLGHAHRGDFRGA